jgi:hypothetical protein
MSTDASIELVDSRHGSRGTGGALCSLAQKKEGIPKFAVARDKDGPLSFIKLLARDSGCTWYWASCSFEQHDSLSLLMSVLDLRGCCIMIG